MHSSEYSVLAQFISESTKRRSQIDWLRMLEKKLNTKFEIGKQFGKMTNFRQDEIHIRSVRKGICNSILDI